MLLQKHHQLLRHIKYFALNFMKKKYNENYRKQEKWNTKKLCDHNIKNRFFLGTNTQWIESVCVRAVLHLSFYLVHGFSIQNDNYGLEVRRVATSVFSLLLASNGSCVYRSFINLWDLVFEKGKNVSILVTIQSGQCWCISMAVLVVVAIEFYLYSTSFDTWNTAFFLLC